jgi:predicted amidohydrolase
MRVAVAQVDIAWEDRRANLASVAPWISTAADAGARLVVLPEMFASGFSMRTDVTAEPAEGPTWQFLRDSAMRHGLWIAGSVALRTTDAESHHNSLLLAAPDGIVHRYDKLHPSGFGEEQKHFSAGANHTTVEVEGLRVTLFVCYDLRFADEFWATAGETDCYVVVANWPSQRQRHWEVLLAARAIENQAYVVACNRVGNGGGDSFSGGSAIIHPWGDVLCTAQGGESLLLADVDPQEVATLRRRIPVLADRRTSPVRVGT